MSDQITLTLPDGSVREVPKGTTPLDVATSIGPRLAKESVGARFDDRDVDLRQPLTDSGAFRLITTRDAEAGPFLRHSAEHVLADAVKRLWPEVEIDAGRLDHSQKFQYDFRYPQAFTPEDLERIEAKMTEILAEDHEFERIEIGREEAKKLFLEMGETLKVERLKEIPEDETITLYRHGRFTDLCRGPHAQRLSQVKAIKLLDTGGVYWKGDERNEMLQRIYGTAFGSAKEMAAYLEAVEQARARDHRKLGAELDLYSFNAYAPASPFFHPKGSVLYVELMRWVQELYVEYGYAEVITPQILDKELWRISGHLDNYREAMFFTEMDERQFAVKPMNCPTHCLIYGTQLRSYRDLPIRYADFGRLHRYERSGVTSGLTRVRSFCQDDAHIFCTDEQIEPEVNASVDMLKEIYDTIGFEEMDIEISTRPEKSIGDAEIWKRAESALQEALRERDIPFRIAPGEGAFYGPKIDFHVQDALGRGWQLGTIQLDYFLPERFDLKYVGADGAEHRTVMLHRALLGSIERFIGILVEHTGGAFPVWLAPVQAVVLPLSEKVAEFAGSVHQRLLGAGVRAELDDRNEKLGYKIREAQVQKIPYMLVVGPREAEAGAVALRLRTGEDLGAVPIEEFLERFAQVSSSKSLEL